MGVRVFGSYGGRWAADALIVQVVLGSECGGSGSWTSKTDSARVPRRPLARLGATRLADHTRRGRASYRISALPHKQVH